MSAGRLRGRADEVGRLVSVLEGAARSGQGALVVVAGEPGIGKTALVGDVARRARGLGFAVGAGKAEPLEQVAPMAPLLVAMRSGVSPLLSAEEFSGLAGVYGQPLWLVDRLTGHIEELAGRSPVLAVIDDLQWADRLTVFALRLMPARLAASPVVWLATTRAAAEGAAQEVLDAGGGDVARDVITLGPLGAEVIEDLARDRLGGPPSERLKVLLAGANGNPLLALYLIDSMAKANTRRAAAAAGGEPALDPAAGQLPGDFVARVNARLGTLPAEVLRFLRAGAVLGSSFTVAAAAALLAVSAPAAVLPWLEAAVQADVVVDNGDRLAFRHDLLRQAVYENIAPSARKALHRRAAEYLLAGGRSPVDAASHVLLGARAGDREGIEILRRAAGIVSPIMPSAAVELIERALGLVSSDDPVWLPVAMEAVSILSRAGRASSAVAVADRLLAAASLSAADRARVQILVSRPLWDLGQLDEIRRRADAELRSVGLPQPLPERLAALRALSLSQNADLAQANAAGESALAKGRTLDDLEAQVFALRALGETARNGARHGRALDFFRQLNALTDDAHIIDEIMSVQLIDRYDRSQELLTRARLRVQDHGDSSRLMALAYAQMWHSYGLGLLDDAEAEALTLLRLCDDFQEHTYRSEARLMLSRFAQLRGEFPAARRQLADADAHLGDDAWAGALIFPLIIRAALDECERDLDAAVAGVRRVLQMMPVTNRLRWQAAWLMGSTRIAVRAGDYDLAAGMAGMGAQLAARNQGVATAAGVAAYTQGLVSGDPALLAAAVEHFRVSPRLLHRAEAIEGLGAALLNAGDRQAGVARLDAAWDAFTELGAHGEAYRVQRTLQAAGVRRRRWTTASRRPMQGWNALTPMEQKVATEIARGESNQAAAAAMGLSPYTVATHLRAAFRKLGVRSRVQLTRAVLEHLDAERPTTLRV